MGRDKALLPWPAANTTSETTLLDAIVANARAVSEYIIIVAGRNAETLLNVAAGFPRVQVITNEDSARGMFSSLQCGASAALAIEAEAVLVFHIDRPPVSPETLCSLLHGLKSASNDAVAAVPTYHGTHGHPYLVNRKLLHEIVAAPLDSNARDLMHATGRVIYVECNDPAVLLNLNTPEDYASAAKSLGPID